MEYKLIQKVTDIIKQETAKEIQEQKVSAIFCDKMNSLFSSADIVNAVSDVSSFISALQTTTSLQAIIPKEILEGLKKGIYKFNESNGEYLAQIINSKDGSIVKNLRLKEIQQLSNPTGMNILSSQIATQMKLVEIQGLIEDLSVQVNRKLDSIRQSQIDNIIAKSEAALIKFEDYKYHPEFNIELKEVKTAIDESILLLKRDIQNGIVSIKEIDSRKKNVFRKTVTPVDIKDAEKIVQNIQEETYYLQILFMVKFYITKDLEDLKEHSSFLASIFTLDCRYMLSAWEYRPNEEKTSLNFFWMNKFPIYLEQITKNTGKHILLEDNCHGQ